MSFCWGQKCPFTAAPVDDDNLQNYGFPLSLSMDIPALTSCFVCGRTCLEYFMAMLTSRRSNLSPAEPNSVLGHRSNAGESVTDSFESGRTLAHQ
ncbi:hypothetical protein CEXT_437341 [Caerostris extrusa]|uniref:Uncharacterized protein n=1 Tax=Caerostris extrusa TaxID=172846 RepID=A0AAV4XMT5_CAEEX|nr:hypothetical protein CEXT_437341 [Caerostris extrusa]